MAKHTKEIFISCTHEGNSSRRLTSHTLYPSQTHTSFPWGTFTHTWFAAEYSLLDCYKVLPTHLFWNAWGLYLVSLLNNWINCDPNSLIFAFAWCFSSSFKDLILNCTFYFSEYNFAESFFSFIYIIIEIKLPNAKGRVKD